MTNSLEEKVNLGFFKLGLRALTSGICMGYATLGYVTDLGSSFVLTQGSLAVFFGLLAYNGYSDTRKILDINYASGGK